MCSVCGYIANREKSGKKDTVENRHLEMIKLLQMLRDRFAFCEILMKIFKTWILNCVQHKWVDVLSIEKSLGKRIL